MALITGKNPLASRPLSEDEWTRLLLKHGYAELAESKQNRGRSIEPEDGSGQGSVPLIEHPAPIEIARPPGDHGAQPRDFTPEDRTELEGIAERSSSFVRKLIRAELKPKRRYRRKA